MQRWINQVWYGKSLFRWILMPLSWLYALVTAMRRCLYRLGIKKSISLPVPVIVVGNITVGGSGKTPTVIYLIELLRQQGYRPGVISRGYGVNIEGVKSVFVGAKANEVGDEPAMIVARTQVPMVVGSQRIQAADQLLSDFDVDIIISDDGLQHYGMARDIEIVILDGDRRLGNGMLLPAGPLREGAWRLDQADFVISNGGEARGGEYLMTLLPKQVTPLLATSTFTFNLHDPVVAIAGIGYPQRFFNSLKVLGYQVHKTHAFDDHQAYHLSDINNVAGSYPLLMTEKDAIKCGDFAQENWGYLAVDASMSAEFEHHFLDKISARIQAHSSHF
ncbi:tetraacyldisaccharide 4'-kinase [Shewanella surugensis]|uniref:Tetraacyldisaccharide 4'-kinase n=1 Tax=Shewanella surugensis TaxID=212020 RepID=A0ABT0LFJ7_9GAMM|nr:tetraacyldisaccharide 4'-kinase [Shewanella surugensis]MCL1126448.1 tetraacyldisaccharide 4'-kinase [Shewanella surugensis]